MEGKEVGQPRAKSSAKVKVTIINVKVADETSDNTSESPAYIGESPEHIGESPSLGRRSKNGLNPKDSFLNEMRIQASSERFLTTGAAEQRPSLATLDFRLAEGAELDSKRSEVFTVTKVQEEVRKDPLPV